MIRTRSVVHQRDGFLDLLDPSLRQLDHPAEPRGEVDLMAASALLVSVLSLIPIAAGASAAIFAIAKATR